jgi:hypothetical protein
MTLPTNGLSISMSQVDTELGYGATSMISLNDTATRNLFGLASGAISMADGWGKSSYVPMSSLSWVLNNGSNPVYNSSVPMHIWWTGGTGPFYYTVQGWNENIVHAAWTGTTSFRDVTFSMPLIYQIQEVGYRVYVYDTGHSNVSILNDATYTAAYTQYNVGLSISGNTSVPAGSAPITYVVTSTNAYPTTGSYQWYYSLNGGAYVAWTTGTSATTSAAALAAPCYFDFYCTYTNIAGTVTSNVIHLTVT